MENTTTTKGETKAPATKTRVRYVVKYAGRSYEYALHSNRRLFIKTIADAINVLEYNAFTELKANNYDFAATDQGGIRTIDIVRLVNDQVDEEFQMAKGPVLEAAIDLIVQSTRDNIQRNQEVQ